MSETEWTLIHRLFDAAIALPEVERDKFLEDQCRESPELLHEVTAMLAADAKSSALNQVIEGLAGDYSHSYDNRFIGHQIGPFEVKELLGRGGMGLVYRAERVRGGFDQQVAIKFLLEPDKNLAKRLAMERQALSQLSHPNIAKIYDAGALEDGSPYLIMEYIRGLPLSQFVEQTNLSQKAKLDLFQTVCDAVAHSHRHLIIHRDIKPSNILVDEAGLPTLLDFGIAKNLLFAQGQQETRTLDRAWSPNYASPEQVRGEPLSTATDIYALGLVLYRLLVGTDAQQTTGLSLDRAIHVICERPVPDLTRSGRLARDLARIIFKAVHKNPEQRYASAKELADDVRRYQAGEAVLAVGDSFGYRLGRLLARNRAVSSIVVGGMLLLAVAIVQIVIDRNLALSAQEATKRQLLRANQVSEFLVEIFKAANVRENRGRVVTAQDLLDKAFDDIGTTTVDPLLKVQLLKTIGAAYTHSGLEENGLKAFGLALETLGNEPSTNPLLNAELLAGQASAYLRSNKHELALPLYQEALAIKSGLLAPDDPEIAVILSGLGATLSQLERLDEGRPYLQQAQAILLSQRPLDQLAVAANHHNLALLEYRAYNNQAALQEINRSLAIKRKVYGAQQVGFADGLRMRSVISRQRGDRDAVMADLNQVLAIYEEKLAPDSVRKGVLIGEIANYYHDLGQFEKAQQYYSTQLKLLQANTSRGPRAIVLNNLASLYEDTQRYALALPLFEESLKIRRELYGDDSASAATAYKNLGRLARRQGNLPRSQPLLEHAAKVFAERLGADHPKYLSTLLEIGWLDLSGGKLEAGKQRIDQARDIMDRNGRKQSPNRARAFELEGQYWIDKKNQQQALISLRRAYDLRREGLDENHPLILRLAAKIASLESP